jgi:hypothetical protein
VEFPALKVSATAKAVKMVYDVLADRVKSVTLGSVRANIADTIAAQQQEMIDYSKDKPSVSLVQKISSALAKAIMGANGGAVRLIDTNDDGEPDELYIADNPDPTQAIKVWRFNYNGWAASKNGYAGPFEFGATLEEGLLANFVTAAQLIAGTIKSQDNGKTFFLDLDNGVLKMSASEFSVQGKTVEDIAGEKASEAVDSQTQQDIFNKLFDNGNVQGFVIRDGKLYINGEYAEILNLAADNIKSGTIGSSDGKININLSSGARVIFNSGIQTNNEFIVKSKDGDWNMFTIQRLENEGTEYFDLAGYDGPNYDYIVHLTRSFDVYGNKSGTSFYILHGDSGCSMYAHNDDAGLRARCSAGSVELGVNGYRNATFLRMNDGSVKDLSWEYSSELGKYVLCGE